MESCKYEFFIFWLILRFELIDNRVQIKKCLENILVI